MDIGPVDIMLLGFDGTELNGAIGPALRDLAARDVVRILDVLLVSKDSEGVTGSIELGALLPQLGSLVPDLVGQPVGGLLDAEDGDEIARDLPRDSSVVVLAIESSWAIPLIDAVCASGGKLIDRAAVPGEVVDDVRRGVA